MTHHPNPNKNAPSTSASSAPPAQHDTNSNPLSSVIDPPNPFTESAPLIADRPAAAASSPTSPAAAVTLSSLEVEATNAPGMARSEALSAERTSRAAVAEVLRPATDGCGKDLQSHSGEIPGLGTNSDVIDIPAFLQRNPDNTFRFPSA